MKKTLLYTLILTALTFAMIIPAVFESKPTHSVITNIHPEDFTLTEEKKSEIITHISKASVYQFISDSLSGHFKTSETGKDIVDMVDQHKTALVKFCKADRDMKGYIIKDMDLSLFQTSNNKLYFGDSLSNQWKIKPMIKVDKETVSLTPNEKVCLLEVVNCEGEIISSHEIRAVDFMDFDKQPENGYYYEGEYIDKFGDYFEKGGFFLDGEKINPKNRNADKCKMDIRIYWLGKCDIWIESIKLENNVATELFSDSYEVYFRLIDKDEFKIFEGMKTDKGKNLIWDYISKRYDKDKIL